MPDDRLERQVGIGTGQAGEAGWNGNWSGNASKTGWRGTRQAGDVS